mmetsp:Transcript_4001/g.8912  ORF Transcript_4001/g.8912 Transcript_4001/m.8912 type:complete len:325 (-) Transcript_4001:1658-2632(-)
MCSSSLCSAARDDLRQTTELNPPPRQSNTVSTRPGSSSSLGSLLLKIEASLAPARCQSDVLKTITLPSNRAVEIRRVSSLTSTVEASAAAGADTSAAGLSVAASKPHSSAVRSWAAVRPGGCPRGAVVELSGLGLDVDVALLDFLVSAAAFFCSDCGDDAGDSEDILFLGSILLGGGDEVDGGDSTGLLHARRRRELFGILPVLRVSLTLSAAGTLPAANARWTDAIVSSGVAIPGQKRPSISLATLLTSSSNRSLPRMDVVWSTAASRKCRLVDMRMLPMDSTCLISKEMSSSFPSLSPLSAPRTKFSWHSAAFAAHIACTSA